MVQKRNIKTSVIAAAAVVTVSVGIWYWWTHRNGRTENKTVTGITNNTSCLERKAIDSYTVDDILKIMDDIIKMQHENGLAVKNAAQLILVDESSTFEGEGLKELVRRIYDHCKGIPFSDLTEKWGISADGFDELARRCEDDPRAKSKIQKILQGPLDDDKDVDWSRANSLSVEDIMQINEAILSRLEAIAQELMKIRSDEVFDNKAASYTAQAISHAYALKKLGIDTRVVDKAIEAHQTELVDLPRFVEAHQKLQKILATLEFDS